MDAYQDYNDRLEQHRAELEESNTNMGAAKFWKKSGETPRPDKSIEELKSLSWLGVFGIDHFYLRSPLTGLAKMLTIGGIGIWWLWDILQVHTETDRVAKFGLSLPFDLKIGIAQGMITDSKPEYAQRTSYGGWQLASIFGFLGADSYVLGKWGQMARKLTEFIFLLIGVITLVVAWRENSVADFVTIGRIMTILLVIFFGGMVIGNWGVSLSNIFAPPMKSMDKGTYVPPSVEGGLNAYESILDFIKGIINFFLGNNGVDKVKADMKYGSIPAEEFKKHFEIVEKEVIEKEEAAERANPAKPDTKWLISFFVWLAMLPLFGFQIIISIIKVVYYWFFPMAALASESTKTALKKAEAMTAILSKQIDEAAELGDLKALEGIGPPSPAGLPPQFGGARRRDADTELSTEAKVLGATVVAIIGGGALKFAIDSLVST